MLNSKRLVLAHFWLAFAVFGLALLLGEWQMFVRSPLNPWNFNPELYYRSVTAHGSAMGYVFPTLIAMGFGYAITEFALKKPLIGRRWAWAGFPAGRRRRRRGDDPGLARARLGALHLLSADGRQSLLLHRRRHGRGRLVDLGRADVDQHGGLEARQPGQAGAAGDVRQRRRRLSLGLDRGRRRARNHFPDPAGGARPALHHRCRPVARVLLLDAARHRLFLADADLHRLLHDLSAGDRRAPVQRRHGAHRLHPVRRSGDADRRASSLCRSAGRRRLQVHPVRLHGAGGAADPGDDLHDLRVRRDRRPAARRQRARSAGSRRCPGPIRSCWRPRCRWSCSASAAPAASST